TTEREILRGYGGGCHQKIGASVLRRLFGEITFLRGVTDDGQILNHCLLKPARPRPPQIPKSEMWPVEPRYVDWFTREGLSVSFPSESQSLWIARVDALPADWRFRSARIVWVSGVQTWKHLAQRGIWVNGCAESLGEQRSPRIETLAGGSLK